MKQIKNILYYWFPPLLWMIIIFYLSSRPRFSITEQYFTDFIIFKSLHMIEYGFLYFLLFRAFYKGTKLPLPQQFLYSFIFSVMYAISDELHQHFVPTREGKLRDIIIDSAGITLIYLYLKHYLDFVKKYL